MEDDEQFDHTIWYECKLCYILLPQKYLIKNHLAESHCSELIQSSDLDQLLNPSTLSHLQQFSLSDLQSEVCTTEDETSDMNIDLSNVKEEHPNGYSDYPEVEVQFGLEKIKTESDTLTDDDDIKSTSNKSKPDLEDKDFSMTSDSLRSLWREVEFPDAVVLLQDCFKIPLPIVKKEGDKEEKCVCIICYKVCSSKQSLKSHRKTHKGEKRFICKTCGKSFVMEPNLQKHELEHSAEWPTLQANPELLYKERRRLQFLRQKHLRSLYVFPTKLQCPYCPRTFPSGSKLKIHIRTHTKEKPYKCLECGSSYKTPWSLNDHKAKKQCENVIEANLLKTVECEICHVRLKNKKILYTHKRRMHKINTPRRIVEKLICIFCGYNASTTFQLNRHNRSHTGEKPFKCLNCNAAFSIKGNMEQHMMRNCAVAKQRNLTVLPVASNKISGRSNFLPSLDPDPEKTKKCQYCDARFILDYRRKYHERVHGDKYPCEFCPTAFAQTMGLLIHIRRFHPGCSNVEKKLKKVKKKTRHICAICNKELTSKSGLERHYLNVHEKKLPEVDPEKTIKCQYCDVRFIYDSQRKYHEKFHGDKYPCKFCPASFGQTMGLSIHIRRFHPGNVEKTMKNKTRYICAICNNKLASNCGLKRHYLNVHKTEPPKADNTKTKIKSNSSATSKLNKSNSYKRPALKNMVDPLGISSEYFSDIPNLLSPTDTKIKTTQEVFLNSSPQTQFILEPE